ncbi:MAG: gamma-glutamyl-gamma-aminobutyrate hydrolase family protein [Prevotella sp.]|nr:gamma-glutamyl-gamma-aminobutyrate hydrolase family protein [Prevotella sp.]
MNYNLGSYLNTVYTSSPKPKAKPVIGITTNYSDIDATLSERYYDQVVKAGGVPVLIPPIEDADIIRTTLDSIDGLLLSGGADYNPLWAGEEPRPELHHINAKRDLPELLITRLAYDRQIPMLGICRGIQTLAMALEGEVEQDIYSGRESRVEGRELLRHSQDADRSEPTHSVALTDGSILQQLYGASTIFVNSFHHQAVRKAGPHFCVTAIAPDGIIEAMESSEHKAIMGVQWHPECLGADGLPIFKWLVDCADTFRKAKALHQSIITIDTHVDTPMFFPQNVEFAHRDSRILVDLHKMTEGRQDAVFMVAYLPQPKPGEPFVSPLNSQLSTLDSPREYADLIFDKIGSIIENNNAYLAQACTPDELLANKKDGKKSIVFGIENGLALEGDISNLKHFKERGVAYITLCHNGDNDICDSARGNSTNNGVSAFGEQVIHEMNHLGIMVDLSHASEKSFYDALDISTKPIVCSHSNCKALCDVPRNLTDDQLRALAKKGGVAHTTFYHGFLNNTTEATILDGIAHLEHAVKIMGIDHVGIGTDFDGDGGVLGMANSSEVISFTIQLLRRRYSEDDIRKIWGGNWLRVWREEPHP